MPNEKKNSEESRRPLILLAFQNPHAVVTVMYDVPKPLSRVATAILTAEQHRYQAEGAGSQTVLACPGKAYSGLLACGLLRCRRDVFLLPGRCGDG